MKSKWFAGIVGVVVGAAIIMGVRAAAYSPPESVHYHANFAVYTNGQREQFKALNYYEEGAATTCSVSSETEDTPMSRVHMHGNINDVVHVEDSRVTWGNFFTVLGWNAGNNYLATKNTVYQASGQDGLTYILNGKQVDSVANTVIGDQDKLLVNYGDPSAGTINQEYDGIKNNALKADRSKDPAACGAGHTNSMPTFRDRMHHMF